jgi:hypothetical protein
MALWERSQAKRKTYFYRAFRLRIKAFSEPSLDRSEKLARLIPLP